MSFVRYALTWAAVVGLLATASTSVFAQQPPPAPGDEAQLIATLQSDSSLFDKAKACQRLATIGTKKAVGELAKLLSDKQLAHYARYGLEPIPDPSVDEALRDAMGRLEGGLLVGVINSIGMRRDAEAVVGLQELMGSSDPDVAAAAMAGMGRIATPPAVESLKKGLQGTASLRPAAADACLTAADMLIADGKQSDAVALYDAMLEADLAKRYHIAALPGAIRGRGPEGLPMLVEQLQAEDQDFFQVGLRMAQELKDPKVTEALVAQLPEMEEERKALLIYVLGYRGDTAALPVVLEAAQSGAESSRLAAVRVLANLGDVSAVPVLLAAAVEAQGELAQSALNSLAELGGEEVDSALAAQLLPSTGKKRQVLIDLVGRRGITSAVPALLKLAGDDDPELRKAAIGALGLTVGPGELPELVSQLLRAKSPEVAETVQDALSKACLRMPDRDTCASTLIKPMASAPMPAKVALFELLGVVGGAKALEAISAAAKDADEDVQDVATRVLGEWMSPDAAPVLLDLAKDTGRFQIRALRGYIRLARQFVSAEEQVAMCKRALDVAERDPERKLILETLGQNASAQALALVVPFLDEQSLKGDASAAAVEIAKKIVQSDPTAVAEAMTKVVEATEDAELAGEAKRLLRRARR
jgi:HEAT repeat protein